MSSPSASASPPPVGVTVRRVPSDFSAPDMQAFLELRTRVLRPAGSPTCTFPGDEEAITAHFGAFEDASGRVLCVATIRPAAAVEQVPSELQAPGAEWQLRGMATDSERRGTGAGRLVLEAAAAHVAAQGGKLLWANCREVAIPFYLKCGWQLWGDFFDVPGIGPHKVMGRVIKPAV